MTVETIDRSRKPEALDVLCEAFYDYPVMRVVLAESGADYDHHLREMIDYFTENRFARGRPLYAIRQDGAMVAVAVCSGAESIPSPPELEEQGDRLDALLGETAVARLGAYDDLCLAGEPECPHHYLGMLGVTTPCRGKGLGRKLVEHLQEIVRSDPVSEGISLNTETAGNVPIYERLGFQIQAETKDDYLHTWSMFWKCD